LSIKGNNCNLTGFLTISSASAAHAATAAHTPALARRTSLAGASKSEILSQFLEKSAFLFRQWRLLILIIRHTISLPEPCTRPLSLRACSISSWHTTHPFLDIFKPTCLQTSFP
jgi:hypothetical protein